MSEDIFITSDDVADIVAILDNTPYEQIDIRTQRFTLRVSRSGEGWTEEWSIADDPASMLAVSDAETPIAEVHEIPEGLIGVPAELPGTFYRAPEPGAEPFIQEGDKVGPETVVCILETMKLMNTVHAGASGAICKILAENAQPVKKGDILFYIEPEAS